MEIKETRVGHVTVVAPSGRLDSTTAAGLEAVLADERLGGLRALVLDLAGLRYVSSAGLRVLLRTAREARARQCRFVLAGLAPAVSDMFEICGVLRLFDVHPDRAAAVAALA